MSWLARLKKPQAAPSPTTAQDALSPATLAVQPAADLAATELDSRPSAQPAMPGKPAKIARQTFMEWAGAWLALDQAYQAHHFKCPTCKAAGLGYGLRCGVGAALWTAYSDATQQERPR